MKLPVVIQTHPGENAIAMIATMLSYYGCIKPLSEMREHNMTSRGGSSPEQVRDMAARYGLETEIVDADMDALRHMKLPVAVRWNKRYYCIVKSIRGDRVEVSDPAKGEYPMTTEAFLTRYMGTVLIMKPGKDFVKGGEKPSLYSLISGRMGEAKKQLITLGVLNVIAVGLNLIMIKATKDMLDVADSAEGATSILGALLANPDDDGNYIYTALVISMSVILVLSTLININKTLLIYSTAYGVAGRSGTSLFMKILSQPMQFFEQYRSGELIQRLEDNSKLDLSLVKTMVPRMLDFVMTIIYFVMMLIYHWQIALICVSVEIIYLLVSMQLKERIAMQSRAAAVSTGAMNTSMLNGLDTIETIKTSGAERIFFSDWTRSQYEYDRSVMSGSSITALTNSIDSIHLLFSQAVLLFAGAWFMINGDFTFGTMAALTSVLTSFRSAFSNCVGMLNTLQKTRTDIERIEDIRQRDGVKEYPLPEDSEPDKLAGTLEVSGLSYRYQEGEALAIEDISFSAKQGELIAVVGSSGCGKSTLLKCLLSLYEPASGEIRYGGLLRSEIPDVVFHSTVTAVDQESVIFEDSISNNLTMWDSTIEDYEMILAARDAHIHSRIMKERDGYYAGMYENGRNFSGGELQRIELARALSAEPTILLLDEFTSALDAVTEAEVFESIRQKGTTCIIVAHRLSTVSSCDHILVMDKGHIVQRGTHEELYNTEGLYRDLLQLPGVIQQDEPNPDASQPKDSQPDASQPKDSQQNGTQPDASQPMDSQQNGTQPDPAHQSNTPPDASQPESTQQNGTQMDPAHQSNTQPDRPQTDIAQPHEPQQNDTHTDAEQPAEAQTDTAQPGGTH